jgi:Cu(I)/Ag(I) efflux system membrane protein CusA/SilA
VDKSGKHDLQELRAFQDFTLRYALASVPGVAEVASVGGFEKVVTLPVAVLASLIATRLTGVSLDIMSLGGIIIAVGDMVDATVLMVENARQRLEGSDPKDRERIIIDAGKELARPFFGSLLIIAVAFLPVFTLEAQERRLFRPLAYTKTFAITAAAILLVTVGPALMVMFIRGRIRTQHANPLSRAAMAVYRPVLGFCLRRRLVVLIATAGLVASTVWPVRRIGSEFMPPPRRRSLPVHASDPPQRLHRGGQGDPAAAGPDHRPRA